MLPHPGWTADSPPAPSAAQTTPVASATPADKAPAKAGVAERSQVIRFIAWPFENILQPTFGLLVAPLEEPLDYFFVNDIPDRAMEFVSFGEKRNIQFYPTLTIASGTGSSVGFGYEHSDPNEDSRWHASVGGEQTVDLDRVLSADITYKRVANSEWNAAWRFRYSAIRDRSSYASDGNFSVIHSDSTWQMGTQWSRPVADGWKASFGFWHSARDYRTAPAILNENQVLAGGDPDAQGDIAWMEARGLDKKFSDRRLEASLSRDFTENAFASTRGYRLAFDAGINFPEGLGNYLDFSLRNQYYLLLGRRPYDLTRQEHRDNQRYLKRFGFDDALKLVDPESFRTLYLERKVLVNAFRWDRLVEPDPQLKAPFLAHPGVGASTPLRAYSARRFVGQANLAWSLEYRWPLLWKVDGVFFNEYGWVYPDEVQLLDGRLHNSWGFGVRVRNPNFFFFRIQMAFHGAEGFMVLATIRPEF
jgi:outer membrane protein assembly factor BamA